MANKSLTKYLGGHYHGDAYLSTNQFIAPKYCWQPPEGKRPSQNVIKSPRFVITSGIT